MQEMTNIIKAIIKDEQSPPKQLDCFKKIIKFNKVTDYGFL